MNSRIVINMIIASTAALISACSPAQATNSPGEVQTVVAATFTAMTGTVPTTASATPTNTATLEPQLTPGEQAHNTYFVQTAAQNVNLRVGPGRLFQVSRVLAQGTRLEVIGISRGGEWYYAATPEGVFGWVSEQFVQADFDGPPPAVIDPEDAIVVIGVVKTDLGSPVSGIGFLLSQGDTTDPSEPRAEARTDEEGRFYAYMPSNTAGNWTVYFVSVWCTSNTMDANCNCKSGRCGEANPESVDITLPLSGELNFVWK